MPTFEGGLEGNDHKKEHRNGVEKEHMNVSQQFPRKIDDISRKKEKKDKKKKERLEIEKRASEEQQAQESVTNKAITKGLTEWKPQFANPADMIYKAVDLNNKIHSTKDSIIERLRKSLEEKYHENEKLKEEMENLKETSAKMLSMPSNVWERQLILMKELMKTMEDAGKEQVEREKTIKTLQAGIQERECIIILLAEELSLAKGAIFQHLSKLEKIRTTTFDASQ